MRYFLGADIGSSKSHACIADETGLILGFGNGGAGNHESVGYEGMTRAVNESANAALRGPASVLFAHGGTSRNGNRWLPDQQITFQVTPRNLDR